MARKVPAAFNVKYKPSATLAAVVGAAPTTRAQFTKKIWDYFKANKLNAGREISADAKLKPLFGKDKITMFEVPGILNKNITKA